MDEVISRIKEFPQDGNIWVVRWIGRIGFGVGENPSPMVEVQLGLWADSASTEPRRAVQLLRSAENTITVHVKVGLLAGLAVGSRFLNGVRIASVKIPEQTFIVDCTAYKVMRADEELAKPTWWTSSGSYKVINKFEYSLGNFLNTKCTILQSDCGIVAIPCTEIVRVMFGCHEDIIKALVSGPWPDGWQRTLANPARTTTRSDGEWQICLRHRIEDDKAPLLANAILNQYGMHQASAVHSSLLLNNRAGYVAVNVPFDVRDLKISGKVVPLGQNTGKFLLAEITEIFWPKKGQTIHVGRDNDAEKNDQSTAVVRPQPYSRIPRHLQAEPGEVVDVVSNEDPAVNSQAIRIPVSGPKLCDQPELRRLPKAESHTYLPAPVSGDSIGCDVLSPGEAHFGDTAAGKSTYSSEERRDTSSRFKELVEMLNSMMQREEIQSWAALPHKHIPAFRGDLPVWLIPNTIQCKPNRKVPWAYVDTTRRVRRSALVCQILIGDRNLIWIEIECRPTGEGFRSLIFEPGKKAPEELVHRFLETCLTERGIWPTDQALKDSFDDVSAITSWTHSYNHDGTIKSKSALARLRLALKSGEAENANHRYNGSAVDLR